MQPLKPDHTPRHLVLVAMIIIGLMVFGLMIQLVMHLMFGGLQMGGHSGLGVVALPHVGIFWRVVASGGAPVLVCAATPVHAAEPYVGHPSGHFETWERLRSLGAGRP